MPQQPSTAYFNLEPASTKKKEKAEELLKTPGYIPSSGYILIKELPIEQLATKYSDHKRLQTFAHKGCLCAYPGCELVGTKLILAREWKNQKAVHVDLYAINPKTGELILMTVDHIYPKSMGGRDEIDNYQPMCKPHNNKKGKKIITND